MDPTDSAPRPRKLTTESLKPSSVKTSITHFDITAATIYGDRAAKDFIESYGESNRNFLASLVRTY